MIKNFTGVDAPYEVPESPDFVLKTDEPGESVDTLARELVEEIVKQTEMIIDPPPEDDEHEQHWDLGEDGVDDSAKEEEDPERDLDEL